MYLIVVIALYLKIYLALHSLYLPDFFQLHTSKAYLSSKTVCSGKSSGSIFLAHYSFLPEREVGVGARVSFDEQRLVIEPNRKFVNLPCTL